MEPYSAVTSGGEIWCSWAKWRTSSSRVKLEAEQKWHDNIDIERDFGGGSFGLMLGDEANKFCTLNSLQKLELYAYSGIQLIRIVWNFSF